MNRPVNRRQLLKATGLAAISTCILPTRAEAGGYWFQGIPDGASDAIKELHNHGEHINMIAFTPDNGWVVLFGSNGYRSAGIPKGASDKLKELNEGGKLIEDISFTS